MSQSLKETIHAIKVAPNGNYIVTTITGKKLWVDAMTMPDGATTICFTEHAVGDKFLAGRDSKRTDPATGKPFYMKGDLVVRQKPSIEIDGFDKVAVKRHDPLALALAILEKNPDARLSLV